MSWYRKPRSSGERKALATAKEHGIRIRAKRGPRGLADEYDDRPKAVWADRGWKAHRDTQYRA